MCRPPSCREALPSLGRPHWGRPVRLLLQHHVCDQPVPLQRRRSQRQLLCLSHGGVCSCASRLATSSDGQRRARDKRARVPGFAARKKNFSLPHPRTRRLSSASLGLNTSLNTSDYDAGRPTTQHQRAENSPLMPRRKSTVPGPDRQLERRASTMLRANAQRSASSRCMTRN